MRIKSFAITALSLIWMAYLLRAMIMNEWGMDFIALMILRFGTLFQFAGLIVILGGLGLKIMRRLRPAADPVLNLIYGTGLGLGFLSIFVFFCGISGCLRVEWIVVFLFAAFAISFREVLEFPRVLRNSFLFKKISEDRISLLLAWCFLLTLLVYFMGAFTPPLEYDTLEYHLGIPDLYAKAGRIFFMPDQVFSHFPMNIEMLYLASILVDKIEFAGFINAFFTLLTGLLIGEFAHRTWNVRAGWIAMTLYVCSSHVFLIGLGKPDVGLVFYCTAAFLLFMEPRKSDAIGAGIFAGFAMGSKYTAFYFVGATLGVVWLYSFINSKEKGKLFIHGVVYTVFLAAFFAPWWVKNLIETGDPFFPMGYPVFKSSIWTTEHFQMFWDYYRRLSVCGRMTLWESMCGMIEESKCFWPSVYMGLPLIILGLRGRCLRLLMIYVGAGFCAAYFGKAADVRFFMPVFPVMSLALAGAFFTVEKHTAIKRLTAVLTALMVFWNLAALGIGIENLKIPSYFLGLVSREDFIGEKLPHYGAIHFLNEIMKSSEKVLFVGESRIFYLTGEPRVSSPLDRSVVCDLMDQKNSSDVPLRRWLDQNMKYVFINHKEIERLNKSIPYWSRGIDWKKFQDFLRQYGKIIYLDRKTGTVIYRIGEEHGA